jgi:hypothetical protein
MYKRIYDSEEIMVDYFNDGNPMIRISQFKNNHFRDEHFVDLPVDLTEVVRCKDCKHRTLDFFGVHCCKLHKGLAMVTDESFCSYGERRTDES